MSYKHKDAPEVEWAQFGKDYCKRSSTDDEWETVPVKDTPKEVVAHCKAETERKRNIEKYGEGSSGGVSAKKV